jgi:hypothetical protein
VWWRIDGRQTDMKYTDKVVGAGVMAGRQTDTDMKYTDKVCVCLGGGAE